MPLLKHSLDVMQCLLLLSFILAFMNTVQSASIMKKRDNDERSFSCSSKSAGLYAYPGDCHKYYYCTYGSSEPTIGNCVGAAFSPSLGRCVAVSRANC